ncbi:hypothetical protein H5410_014287 [Solanum commersonii]|uniref:Uncharacterized protein n=1 Tax=Solanum commersonii TaxID=4109 RepID=A0A9J5ZQZ8_SOLCO|nr:hypothetical protein H5410_014287 [Solanum commersonii]
MNGGLWFRPKKYCPLDYIRHDYRDGKASPTGIYVPLDGVCNQSSERSSGPMEIERRQGNTQVENKRNSNCL